MDNNGLIQRQGPKATARNWLRNGLLTPLLVAMCCLLGTSLPALASSAFETPGRLMHAAKQYIHHAYDDKYDVSVDFGYLDSRLRLEKCQQPLEAFFPPSMQDLVATSVGVRCTRPNWQVYIPVEIHAYAPVLTASHPLARDTIIAASDIKLRKREISQYRSGVFEDKQQLIGMVLKRPLAEGSVFTPREVMPKRLVRRGEPVTIMAESSGMTVRVQGQALMDGNHGQMIQVRNTHSGRKIVAEVIGTSTVRVKM
jgi:flagella basal body P-ring formation protein FlgA